MAEALLLPQVAPRTGVTIGLGVLAIVILGPIAGVPGWLIANQDLRDLRAGIIPTSAQRGLTVGKWLSIIGTFLSPLWVWLFCVMAFVLMMVVGEMIFMP